MLRVCFHEDFIKILLFLQYSLSTVYENTKHMTYTVHSQSLPNFTPINCSYIFAIHFALNNIFYLFYGTESFTYVHLNLYRLQIQILTEHI